MAKQLSNDEFAARLKGLLIDKNMLAADLARLTGISKGVISRYLHGQSLPSQNNMMLLADALSTSINYLVYGEIVEPKKTKYEKLLNFLGVKEHEFFELVDTENGDVLYRGFFDNGTMLTSCIRRKESWVAYDSDVWEYMLIDERIEVRKVE